MIYANVFMSRHQNCFFLISQLILFLFFQPDRAKLASPTFLQNFEIDYANLCKYSNYTKNVSSPSFLTQF